MTDEKNAAGLYESVPAAVQKNQEHDASPHGSFQEKSGDHFEPACRGSMFDAMIASGIGCPKGGVIADGNLHRFNPNGRHDASGWYVSYGDYAAFGDWASGIKETWYARKSELTDFERRKLYEQIEVERKKCEAEERVRHEAVAAKLSVAYHSHPDAKAAPYLTRKRVQAFNIKCDAAKPDALILPMRDVGGRLWNYQTIYPDGTKRFQKGARKKGCFLLIGANDLSGVEFAYIVEGYATGASVHMATGKPVVVAFDAGNLDPVVAEVRSRFPSMRLVIAGDDDRWKPEVGNIGRTKAEAVAEKHGCRAVFPEFKDDSTKPTDFNDLHVLEGLEVVQMVLDNEKKEKRAYDVKNAATHCVDLLRGDCVKMEPIDWLWEGWLARGKVHIIAGIAGTGKTTIALSIAAAITCGGKLPDGSVAPVGDVVIWSGEDDPSDTLAPRLKAMGADMSRIHFVNGVKDEQGVRPFDPAKDIAALSTAINTIKPVMLIVDPIVSAVAGDSHKNTETRRAMQPLVEMGMNSGVAVLGISHFSKGTSGHNPIERVTGSLAFGALARLVMAVGKVGDEQGGGRIFCRAKSNIGADGGGFQYDLEQVELEDHHGISASRVIWGAAVDGSAMSLLAEAETSGGEGGGCLAEAKEFLETELAYGPVTANQLKRSAEQAGYSWRTVDRAKRKLGIKSRKEGMKGSWAWFLPMKNAKSDEDSHLQTLATFEGNGVLLENPPQKWEAEL